MKSGAMAAAAALQEHLVLLQAQPIWCDGHCPEVKGTKWTSAVLRCLAVACPELLQMPKPP